MSVDDIILGVLILLGNSLMDKTYTIPAESIPIHTDPSSLVSGAHIVQTV